MNYTDSHPIFWDSCGCESDTRVDLRKYIKNDLLWRIDRECFENNVSGLDYNLATCSSLEEMLKCIPEGVPAFKCDALYLVVDPLLADINDAGMSNVSLDALANYEDRFRTEGFPEEMTLLYSYENGVPDPEKSTIERTPCPMATAAGQLDPSSPGVLQPPKILSSAQARDGLSGRVCDYRSLFRRNLRFLCPACG